MLKLGGAAALNLLSSRIPRFVAGGGLNWGLASLMWPADGRARLIVRIFPAMLHLGRRPQQSSRFLDPVESFGPPCLKRNGKMFGLKRADVKVASAPGRSAPGVA